MGSLFVYLQPSRFPNMKSVDGWYEYAAVYCINRGACYTLVVISLRTVLDPDLLPASILQFASFILFLAIPKQQVWILFHFITSKSTSLLSHSAVRSLSAPMSAYINSLLLMLNFRNVHHGRGIDEEESLNQRDFKSQQGSTSHSRTPGLTSRSVQFGVVDTDSKVCTLR